jgi:hypothetical protein
MISFSELWGKITDNIINSEREQPTAVHIPPENVDPDMPERKAQMARQFEGHKDYFLVRVNQLFLQHDREWFTQVDPMVIVVSEFQYKGKQQTVPYVVGPSLIQQKFPNGAPKGMVITNEKVAGLYPFRGGELKLSVVLCQTPVGKPAQAFLKMIERSSKAFDFATALGSYITIGQVVLEGIDAMFGVNGTQPLVGYRTTIDKNAGDEFKPGYYALINKSGVKESELWVIDDKLLKGESKDVAKDYCESDFVLYSIVRPPDGKRDDIEQLPFYELWERAVNEATLLKEGGWDNARGTLVALINALALSPDLTRRQAMELMNEYSTLLKPMYEQAKKASTLSDYKRDETEDELDDVRRMASSILNS